MPVKKDNLRCDGGTMFKDLIINNSRKLLPAASVCTLLLIVIGCAATSPQMKITDSKAEDPSKKRAMDLFIDGKVAESSKNYGNAIASYMEALQFDPQSVEITLALAKAFIGSGKFRSALIYSRKTVELDPESSDGWLLVQYLEQHEGNFKKSAEAMEMYMKLTDDRDFSAVIKLAQLYFTIGKTDKAKEVIFSGIRREETPAADMMQAAEFLIANGLTDDALSIYLWLIERDPTDEKAWVKIGAIHNMEGREKEAEQTYKLALEKNPDSFRLMRSVGNQCLLTNDWECAITWFKKAVSAGDDNIHLARTLCAIYFYAGRDDEGVAAFDSLKSNGEDNASLYFSLGKAMNYLDRHEEALNYYRTGLSKIEEKYPERQLMNVFVGMVRALVKLDRKEEALDVIREEASATMSDKTNLKILEANMYFDLKRYDDAIAIWEWLSAADPENTRFLISMSLVYDVADQFNNAEKVLLKVLELEPEHSLALNNLAYMYMEHEININKAITMVKSALVLEPDNGAYHDTLGWGYYRKGKYKDARKHIENALKLADKQDKGVIYEHLGDIHVKLNKYKEAIEAYRNAIEFGEDNDRIQPKLDALK